MKISFGISESSVETRCQQRDGMSAGAAGDSLDSRL